MIPKSCGRFGQDHATNQVLRAKWDPIPLRTGGAETTMADWVREADEPVSPDTVQAAISSPPRVRWHWPSRARLLSVGAAVLLSLPTAVYFWFYEGAGSNQIFVWSVTLA